MSKSPELEEFGGTFGEQKTVQFGWDVVIE